MEKRVTAEPSDDPKQRNFESPHEESRAVDSILVNK